MTFVIEDNVNLRVVNTLGLSCIASHYCRVASLKELEKALDFAKREKLSVLPLGGGSNLVLPERYTGLVINLAITGIEYVEQDSEQVIVHAAAGENWHCLVMESIGNGYFGLENLALIPGNVGAAPIQNIGAYGLELSERFLQLSAIDLHTGQLVHMTEQQCEFSYRNSLFKKVENIGRYIITSVSLLLSRQFSPVLHYQPLRQAFIDTSASDITARAIADQVIRLRQAKLPDVVAIANVGSFFKNPLVSLKQYQQLKRSYPELVAYPQANDSYKLAAAWLIDTAGWRGYRNDAVGVHSEQALVLINHSDGSAKDILNLAADIRQDIQTRFGVCLEIEPCVVE